MAACSKCKRPIKNTDRNPVTIKNEKGQITGQMHNKCWHVSQKPNRPGTNDKGRFTNVPTPYEMATGEGRKTREDLTPEMLARREEAEKQYEALRIRQQELAEDRAEEETPSAWNDWRDPQELELDELLEVVDEKKRELDPSPSTGDPQALVAENRLP